MSSKKHEDCGYGVVQCMFHVLGETGSLENETIQDPPTLTLRLFLTSCDIRIDWSTSRFMALSDEIEKLEGATSLCPTTINHCLSRDVFPCRFGPTATLPEGYDMLFVSSPCVYQPRQDIQCRNKLLAQVTRLC